ncbi:nibrin-like isoform X1 [Coregonus clupeaformis]|uniref:nibrin-like isoform X1 n=1 Tax=Coregonus clupeaformis TaxID=59861 RepID=UPI001E1C854E|nr:nibrin-like isoform X1 [Coregonus clupeaformis]
MWTLKPLESGAVTHYLLPGKEYVVGRKNCEVILPNDQSISRAHAHLTATDQTLTLKDCSKYGTFVNEERLSGDTPRSLTAGDRVTFGVFHSKFSVQQVTVVVCSSCVDNEGKISLSQALQPLGGRLANTWTQDCTHLVMPTVKVTIKTICALLCCRPIVKQEFFTELTKALQQKQPPPKAESFFPEIDEPSLNKDEVDLTERPERKELFTDKTFLFLNAKQQKRLSLAVSCGGGRSQLLEEGSVPVSLLESPLSCVINMATGNSQALVPPSTKKWADSVGRILQRKGLRFITESEIGLAAIYVSCDKYCNPSNQMADSESMRMKPTIPGATLSQNAPVDETVLPAASQNITAYAVNTEPSQGISGVDVAGVSAVGETPERDQSRTTSHLDRPKCSSGRELAGTCTVAETMMSSFSASDSAGGGGSDRKKGEIQHPGGGKGDAITRFLATAPRTNGGVQTMSTQKCSSQKQQVSQKGSPQKQSALTSFFQPVGKKRPREGKESPTVQSEAKLSRREEEEEKRKRTEPQHTETSNTTHTRAPSNTTTHTPSATTHTRATTHTPTGRSQGQQSSGAGQTEALSEGVSHPAQQGLQSRKRKEMEEETKGGGASEIEMDELESIMSEDMDESDEPMSASQGQRSKLTDKSSIDRKQLLKTVELTSANKKQRVDPVEPITAYHGSSLDSEEGSSANKRQRAEPVAEVKEEEVSFIEAKPVSGVAPGHLEKPETDTKPSKPAKQKASGSGGENLPSRLLVVEFKSLTGATLARPKPRPTETHSNVNRKDFKRFRKVPVPGAQGLPNIIGGSDLLAHNRGKNSELEEWLRDAAEDERQSKKEETLGDDLFRYNPKPTKKR